MNQRFRTNERLKHRKAIEAVFAQGSHISIYPLRLVWMPRVQSAACASPVRMAFSVPKRLFKLGTDRNRIKRRMREAWRLQKAGIYQQLDKQMFDAMLIYNGKEMADFHEIALSLRKICSKWVTNMQNC